MAGSTPEQATAIAPWRPPALPAAFPEPRLVHRMGRLTASAKSLSDEAYTGSTGILNNVTSNAQNEQGKLESPEEREAWTAYERIPEVRTLVHGSANLLSAVRLYVGVEEEQNGRLVQKSLRDNKGQPLAGFDEAFVAACEDALARYTDMAGRQTSLLRGIAENFQVVGRARLVGYVVDTQTNLPVERDPDGERFVEKWTVAAPGALYRDASAAVPTGRVAWRLYTKRTSSIQLKKAVVKEFLWASSRYPDEASAWVSSCIDACRDLRAFSLANRAAARSGIPADLFLIPSEASPAALPTWNGQAGGVENVPPPTPGTNDWGPGADGTMPEGETPADEWATKVEALIGEFILGVLADADAGNSAVPGVLSIESRFIEHFTRISFSRPIDRGIAELQRDARVRIAQAADASPELLQGLGKTNRWNGQQIAEDEYRRYFKPKAEAIADGFTEVCFWPELRLRGYKATQYRQVRVLVDASAVIAEPDWSKLAPLALDRGAIGPSGFRKLLSIPEDCAPTDAELKWIEKMRGKVQQGASSGTGQGDQGPPSGDAGDPGAAGRRALPAMAVAVADDLGRDLLPIEHRTRARLEEACELAFDQALDRAGAKLRSWGQRDEAAAVLAAAERAAAVPVLLGPEACLRIATTKLGADDDRRREEMFAAAVVALLASWRRIALDAYAAAVSTIGTRAKGTVPQAEVEMAVERSEAVLRESMMLTADAIVFGPGIPSPTVGEVSNLRVPGSVIRRVLAVAGGNNGIGAGLEALADAALGLVFGPLLERILPARTGLQWVYGDEPRQRPFEQHLALDGVVYVSAQDDRLRGSIFSGSPFWHPGDHNGCRCDWVPTYQGS